MKTVAPRGSLYTPRGNRKWRLAWLLVPVSSTCCFSSIPAQTQERKERVIEELIVTAQRREERLQDVPISITALSGDDLDESSVQGIAEALKGVPNVVDIPGTRSGNNPRFVVRGVVQEAEGGNGTGPVGYYLDSAPFGLAKSAFTPEANPYDLERIEVLRGPQGTLYGMSSLNGVVRILTKSADLDDFELKGRASTSMTKHGDDSFRGDAALNVPLIKDKLAARAVVSYQDIGGWIDKPIEEDANDGLIKTGRLKLKAQPTDELSFELSGWISRGDYGAPPLAPDGRQTPSRVSEDSATDYDVYTGKLEYEFPGVSLTSSTSYLDYKNDAIFDFTNFPATAAAGFGTNYFVNHWDSQVFTQEISLASTHEGAWQWTAGGIYRDAEDTSKQDWWAPVFPAGVLPVSEDEYKSESFAFFGELTRRFNDGQFEVTAGLRYFEDTVTDKSILFPSLPTQKRKFDATSPRVVLKWRPDDQTTVYASYGEGFRSGLNQRVDVIRAAPEYPPAKPDTLTSYELGAKKSMWDGRANVETALYYIDWQDVQQSLIVPVGFTLVPAFINGGSASGMGFEMAASVMPVDDLTLRASFGWNDLRADGNTFDARGVLVREKGVRLGFSPETTASVSADYGFPLTSSGFEGRLSMSGTYTSKTNTGRLSTATRPNLGESIILARASFAIETPYGLIVTAFADNLFDNNKAYVSEVWYSASGNSDWAGWSTRIRPRTIGLQFEFKH